MPQEQQNFILFDNEANFAKLDTYPGAAYDNGLYEQLTYVFDNLSTGWNQFSPVGGENHNDWAAGGVGSDTLIGDVDGDLSCETENEKGADATTTQSNDILYGGSGFYIDYDGYDASTGLGDTQRYINDRVIPTDDGDDSTPPPFDTFDFGGFDIRNFSLENADFYDGPSPRFDFAGDELIGGRGNDTVFGQFGHDTLDGGGGKDWLFGGRNADLMDGDYLSQGDVDQANDDRPDGRAFNTTEPNSDWRQDNTACDDGDRGDVMFGERGKDTMFGGDDSVYGYTGFRGDVFRGSNGQECFATFKSWNYDGDWMSGGRGADIMYGENGFDTMYGDECADTMKGGDHYDLMYGGRGADLMYGGTDDSEGGGTDLEDDVQARNTNLADTCEFRCAYEGNFDYTGAMLPRGGDTMYGGNGADSMYGGRGDDLMYGGNGGDSMNGGDDDDRMLGEVGADIMNGGDGWDDMSGGTGFDTMTGGNGDDYMEGNQGEDDMQGNAGRDIMWGNEDHDKMQGNSGDDIMYGNDGMDYMEGGADNDIMYGGADMDMLWGNDGNDCMDGGTERDILQGGEGNDTMDGGDGIDTVIGGDGDDVIYLNGAVGTDSTHYEMVAGDNVEFNYTFDTNGNEKLDPNRPGGDDMFPFDNSSYQPIDGDGDGADTFIYNFTFDEENQSADGDDGFVFIADFTQNEDTLQLCFNDPITTCCDDNGIGNTELLIALSQPDENGQHAVKVIDNGVDTKIIFDGTTYPDGQSASDPEGGDASDPDVNETIWLQGVTLGGVDGPRFATLYDLDLAGYSIQISQEHCYSDCGGCDIDPFGTREVDNVPDSTDLLS